MDTDAQERGDPGALRQAFGEPMAFSSLMPLICR
jgi:hypothetical protein